MQADGRTETHPSTRNENEASTMLARSLRIPVWSGQSFSAMRAFKLAEWVGGSTYEIGAVAWGLFSFWRLNFDHTTQFAYHTLHETLDIAQNFGVSYSMTHQYAGLKKISVDRALNDSQEMATSLLNGRIPGLGAQAVHSDHTPRQLERAGKSIQDRIDRLLNLRQHNRSEKSMYRAFVDLMDRVDREARRFGIDRTL
jgi:hypothetical protein